MIKKYLIVYIQKPITKKSAGKLGELLYRADSPKEAAQKFHKHHPGKHIKHIYKA